MADITDTVSAAAVGVAANRMWFARKLPSTQSKTRANLILIKSNEIARLFLLFRLLSAKWNGESVAYYANATTTSSKPIQTHTEHVR